MLLNDREQILALTREWKGERYENGRPKVSDEKIEILKTLTQEEIWQPLYACGYRFQFQGNMRALHEDKKLYGRAVTCCFMPQRPDMRQLAFDTARAKGRCQLGVIAVHALRNALLPVVTMMAVQLSSLLSGAVICETVFSVNGVGRLAVQAIEGRDIPLLQGTVLFSTLLVVLGNLAADCLYAVLDPRTRKEA